MKSITIAIRNNEQRIIGLLCINLHINAPFHEFVQSFLPQPSVEEKPSPESFPSSVEELVSRTVESTIVEVNADTSVANNTKNKQIVLSLYEKGIFDIKDSINLVAEKLNISKHTVYLYIRQKKNDN